jgi:hypothetical protein
MNTVKTKNQTQDVLAAVEAVVNYLWDDERVDYVAEGRPKDHIFRRVEALARWAEAVRGREVPAPWAWKRPLAARRKRTFTAKEVALPFDRAAALGSGRLVDVTAAAAREGFGRPVAMTAALWDAYFTTRGEAGESAEGLRLSVFFTDLRLGLPRSWQGWQIVYATADVEVDPKTVATRTVKVVIGPDACGAPVYTVMLPYEG